jgi:hypothetical protein
MIAKLIHSKQITNAMENKQTAVDYLYMLMHQIGSANDENNLKIYNQAKQMEKEQLINAYEDGDDNGRLVEWGYQNISSEQFYNETYEQ